MHLASLWALSHFLFALCMLATFFTSTVSGATLILSVTGFCWAITQWAPFALLGEAILSQPTSDDAGSILLADTRSTRVVHPRDDVEDHEETRQLFQADIDDEDEEEDVPNGHHARPKTIGLGNARGHVSRIDLASPPPFTAQSGSARKSTNGLSSQAGAILGIHNIFLVIPQFLVTGLSSLIFAVLDPGPAKGISAREDGLELGQGSNSVAIIFRLGGIAAAIAFVLSYRLAKDLGRRWRGKECLGYSCRMIQHC